MMSIINQLVCERDTGTTSNLSLACRATLLFNNDQVTSAALEDDTTQAPPKATPTSDVEPYSKPFTADKILIAVGTKPARRPDFDFDGTHIIDSDDLLSGSLKRIPHELIVVGAGKEGGICVDVCQSNQIHDTIYSRCDWSRVCIHV